MRRISVFKIFAFIFLSASLTTLSFSQTAPLNEGLAEIDINNPPAHLKDSALFHFLRSRNLKRFPASFVELVRELKYAEYSPVRVAAPRGESTQRAFTDEYQPRSLIASASATKIAQRPPLGFEDYSTLNGSDYEGRLFFGFAKNQKQTEIISWNFSTSENDLIIVENMEDQITFAARAAPVVVKEVVNRENCTKCHQNEGAAIFTPQPWSQIVTHDPSHYFGDPQQAPKFTEAPTLYEKDGLLLSVELTPFENNSALAFSHSVSTNNRLKQARQVLLRMCGLDTECRRMQVLAAMSNPNQSKVIRVPFGIKEGDTNSLNLDITVPYQYLSKLAVPDFFKQRQKTLKYVWPPAAFAYPAETLPDIRDIATRTTDFFQVNPQSSRGEGQGITYEQAMPYVYDTSFEAFGFNLAQSRELKKYNTDLRNRLFIKNGTNSAEVEKDVDALLKSEQWPATPDQILSIVRKYLRPSDTFYTFERPARAIAADFSFTDIDSLDTQTSAPQVMQKYCGKCHSDQQISNFRVDDPLFARTWNHSNGKIAAKRVLNNEMPPVANEDTAPTPSQQERRLIAAFLNSDQGLQNFADASYFNHLNVRVSTSTNTNISYIANSSPITKVQTSYMELCSGRTSTQRYPNSYLVVQDEHDVHIALENFPQYVPGSLIQAFAIDEGRRSHASCLAAALTRRGKIVYMYYDPGLRLHVSKTATSDSAVSFIYIAPPQNHLTSANPADNIYYGIGNDKKIYQITFSYDARTYRLNYTLKNLPVANNADFNWMNITALGNYNFLLRSVENEIVQALRRGDTLELSPRLDGTPVLNRVGDDNVKISRRFAPNLIDRFSTLVIPTQSEKKSSREISEPLPSEQRIITAKNGLRQDFQDGPVTSLRIDPNLRLSFSETGIFKINGAYLYSGLAETHATVSAVLNLTIVTKDGVFVGHLNTESTWALSKRDAKQNFVIEGRLPEDLHEALRQSRREGLEIEFQDSGFKIMRAQ